jgi:DNA-binding helix-hairpin-helix protein with protein kinase domain
MSDLLFEAGKESHERTPLTLRHGDKGRRGASGMVFELSSDGKGIKDYFEKERSKLEPKVQTMLKVRYNRRYSDRYDLAWPEARVVDESGNFRGFKMAFFGDGWVDLDKLIQASEALQKYGLGERHRLRIAGNLAMAVKALHDRGIHCIDLKPDNARINLKNMATALIDCDGMSIVRIGVQNSPRYYADRCTPEFVPPENHGLMPYQFRDEETHDRFSLATIIFMLLNRGLHPYSGIVQSDDPDTESTAGKIKNNLYPYGAGSDRIRPRKDSIYPFLPEDTKRLFDRAFSGPKSRPSAAQHGANALQPVG